MRCSNAGARRRRRLKRATTNSARRGELHRRHNFSTHAQDITWRRSGRGISGRRSHTTPRTCAVAQRSQCKPVVACSNDVLGPLPRDSRDQWPMSHGARHVGEPDGSTRREGTPIGPWHVQRSMRDEGVQGKQHLDCNPRTTSHDLRTCLAFLRA